MFLHSLIRHSYRAWVLIAAALAFSQSPAAEAGRPPSSPPDALVFRQPDAAALPNLFVWTDTCNVYVLRDGDSALLIDLGDGSVLDHLATIGVKRVEWVLFTHHHREQCQGYPRLKGWNAKIAAPEAERAFFERPLDFRPMKVRRDPFTIHGSSFLRPPRQPIPLDRTFKSMDSFEWRGHTFWCLETPGNSPGSMSYLLRSELTVPNAKSQIPNPKQGTQNPELKTQNLAPRWIAFTGDLMLAGARLHTWFDSEWDYGNGAGIAALIDSVEQVAGFDSAWLMPSHGPAVREPAAQLEEFKEKLFRLQPLYLRGGPAQFASAVYDRTSRPTIVPHVWQVLPHVYKFRGPRYFPNFYLIVADSGRALAIDCGMLEKPALDAAIEGMKAQLGLKKIDAMIPTHMHGDHFREGPYLREKWGAQLWALDRMGPVCEFPERFDYAAPIQFYGVGIDSVKFDRLFKAGEVLEWEGFRFTIDWMPGQTEFALCVTGIIDGKRVAFTGDNIFGDPDDPRQNGHEAMVAHNSAVLEEGYIYGAEYLSRLKPDILLGGHSWVMDKPAGLIERYRQWAYAMRDAFRTVSSEEDYRYWFDPFWVRAYPYRSSLPPGGEMELELNVRNFRTRSQSHRIEIHAPPGFAVEPAVLEGNLAAEVRGKFPVRIRALEGARPGVHLFGLDITRDGHRHGELFDFVVEVTKP